MTQKPGPKGLKKTVPACPSHPHDLVAHFLLDFRAAAALSTRVALLKKLFLHFAYSLGSLWPMKDYEERGNASFIWVACRVERAQSLRCFRNFIIGSFRDK